VFVLYLHARGQSVGHDSKISPCLNGPVERSRYRTSPRSVSFGAPSPGEGGGGVGR
jgi:hypothetical protein